jgi:hypothetical protein
MGAGIRLKGNFQQENTTALMEKKDGVTGVGICRKAAILFLYFKNDFPNHITVNWRPLQGLT